MVKLILLLVSYILASIPCGLVVAYLAKGIDIRKHGSGNIGATNVLRVVGKPWGIITFILDFLKGLIGPILGYYFFPQGPNYFFVLLALIAVSGHIWPIFLKFKGGKGVATSVGAITGLGIIFPYALLALGISLISWIIIFFSSRYVSLASILATGVFFITALFFPLPKEMKLLALALFVFILVRHKKNIERLLANKENKF